MISRKILKSFGGIAGRQEGQIRFILLSARRNLHPPGNSPLDPWPYLPRIAETDSQPPIFRGALKRAPFGGA